MGFWDGRAECAADIQPNGTIAVTDRKTAGKMPALPLKTHRAYGRVAQSLAPLHDRSGAQSGILRGACYRRGGKLYGEPNITRVADCTGRHV
ncbi:MAG TPA: hypothetical protein VHP80_16790, partial [Candidatus Acidoferrum sp.]|nr:hypothetical protein [Candidatus Acidoferrum sp.]